MRPLRPRRRSLLNAPSLRRRLPSCLERGPNAAARFFLGERERLHKSLSRNLLRQKRRPPLRVSTKAATEGRGPLPSWTEFHPKLKTHFPAKRRNASRRLQGKPKPRRKGGSAAQKGRGSQRFFADRDSQPNRRTETKTETGAKETKAMQTNRLTDTEREVGFSPPVRRPAQRL